MLCVGIDPGKNGIVARLDGDSFEHQELTYNHKNIDVTSLLDVLARWINSTRWANNSCMVVVERPMFARQRGLMQRCENYGRIMGALTTKRLPSLGVTARDWQARILGQRDFVRPQKSKARVLAFVRERFPNHVFRNRDHDLADAICMALYAETLCQ
jgi:hypothetical protein